MICFIGLALVGCSSEQVTPSMHQEADAAESKDVELDEKETPEPHDVLIQMGEQKKRFTLRDLPLLKGYLETSSDQEGALQSMQLQKIATSMEQSSLYLLRYACHKELCSYLFIKETKDEVQSRLVSDLSTFKGTLLSPDQEKVLFLFSGKEQNGIRRDELQVFNLNQLEPLSISKDSNIEFQFKWPIIKASWSDGKTINIEIPKVEDATNESIVKWKHSIPTTRETRTFTLTIED